MKKDRIGIIDIGTNTFNLLVVDRIAHGFEKVFSGKAGVGLGLGGIHRSLLTQDAMQRGLDQLEKYVSKSRELKVDKLKAFGTSAMRDATNREEFLKMIAEKLDLEVEVISGEQEAYLIYEGVKMGYAFDEPALIMDIGGGSTEFIYANAEKVLKAKSFDIGTARIFENFEFSDPYSKEDVQAIIAYLEENTIGFFEDVETDVMLGASGSFETFYALLNHKEYPENEFEDMDAGAIIEVLDEIIFSTYQERMKNPFIIPIRKKMAPIAAIKIKWILQKLNIKTLTISPFAMKEGVIKTI